MSKWIFAALAASMLCLGTVSAQTPITVAIEEFSSNDDSLVSFRKLLSEYVVTELAACNLTKVVGYDTVNSAKVEFKANDLKQADIDTIQKVLKKLKAGALCSGSLSRVDGMVKAELKVFKDGAWQTKTASASMKTIEGSDDAAKVLATQVESIVKGTPEVVKDEPKALSEEAKAQPEAPKACPASAPAAATGCCNK